MIRFFKSGRAIFSSPFVISLLFMLSSMQASGQNKEYLQSVGKVNFFGVDFSKVNIISEDEPAALVAELAGIDELFISNPRKYVAAIEKKLGLKMISIDIENVAANLKEVEDPSSLFSKESKLDDANNAMWDRVALADLDLHSKVGTGLVIMAVELDDVEKLGYYKMIFFDMATKEVHDSFFIGGRAVGVVKKISLRNYWSGTLQNAINKIEL